MSYILEALKQSEHARQQGKAPALNSLPPLLAPPRETAGRRPPAYLLLALGLALIGAGLGWWRPWQNAVAGAVVQAPPAETPAPRSAPPAPVAPALAAVAASPAPAAERPGPAVASQPPLIRLDPPAAPEIPPSTPALAATQPAARPAPALPAPPERVLGFHELPAELRQNLPRLSLSGFSYAEEPQLRMAVINERILHQGDQAGPGIVLERIASDGVVLNYRGFRFRPR
jgi:general secretion pathway protein B